MNSWNPASIHALDIQVQALIDSRPCPIRRAMRMSLPYNAPLSQKHEVFKEIK